MKNPVEAYKDEDEMKRVIKTCDELNRWFKNGKWYINKQYKDEVFECRHIRQKTSMSFNVSECLIHCYSGLFETRIRYCPAEKKLLKFLIEAVGDMMIANGVTSLQYGYSSKAILINKTWNFY